MELTLLFWYQFFDYFEHVITICGVSLFYFNGSTVGIHVEWYKEET